MHPPRGGVSSVSTAACVSLSGVFSAVDEAAWQFNTGEPGIALDNRDCALESLRNGLSLRGADSALGIPNSEIMKIPALAQSTEGS